MCLGIPAKILSIDTTDCDLLPATVDFGGIHKSISLCFTPDAQLGDYVLVHVGFAIKIIDEASALELIAFLDSEGDYTNEVSV